MYIAPNIHATEWRRLELADLAGPDWIRAIEIGRARIYGRYFDAVDLLINAEENLSPKKRRYGFAILAIDCLLVETIQAFKDGITDTRKKSKGLFRKFLMNSPLFGSYFSDEKQADEFYDQIRCGILHQGETKKDSKVWSVGSFLQRTEHGIIVNRTEFHKKLKKEFDQYLKDLIENTDPRLRENYRKVMNHISRTTG